MIGLLYLLQIITARQYTISGFSSGGFFAHQLHVAFSQNITGVGIIAGGPYYCTMGSYSRFQTACKLNSYFINLPSLVQLATTASNDGLIDSLGNLSNSMIYIFSGTRDNIVDQSVVKQTEAFYRNFIGNSLNLQTNYIINAQHSWVTNNEGNPCWYLGWPGVNNCNFDLSGAILEHIFGDLTPKGVQNASNLYSFSQADYADIWKAGLSNQGFIYIPVYCLKNICRVHVVFHGCLGGFEYNGLKFIEEIGVNEYVIIYPQLITHNNNPLECWDMYGYTRSNFMYQSGLQMTAANLMAQEPPIVKWNE